jgi:tagatose-1,6-bisphosphate aldolase non-catalytic subunit AgaZ/GatZ
LKAAAGRVFEDGNLLSVANWKSFESGHFVDDFTGCAAYGLPWFAEQIVDVAGFDQARLMFGGDHLVPSPVANA